MFWIELNWQNDYKVSDELNHSILCPKQITETHICQLIYISPKYLQDMIENSDYDYKLVHHLPGYSQNVTQCLMPV